ncbi:flagellar basal-body MS-ring/collar protein FliF [Porcipelethomonas sp.]|uniref:flagellar basal-body MS-ring/collar protein FliF n=1 Tax=Porcipelethomonas sp. TaxID=2981675 RepID=UPI003EF88B75
MKEKFKKIWEKIKTLWSGFTKVVKIAIIVGLVVIIGGSVGLTIFLNRSNDSDWIVLFPGMSNEESTEVYLELQNKGVETKINSDGEIEVKKTEWDDLVYELAQLGYPQSTPSYGTFFDNLSMTMTEFEKKQTLRFELQDRLQTTLKRIDGIEGAVVTITFPESSDYAWKETTDKAKASVTLTLSNSAGFTAENVSAVKNLVAFSAQQIEPENVTVIDSSTGKELLSAEETETADSSTGIDLADKMEYANTLKAQYEANARAILQNIYPDGVDAVATVEIDYDKVVEEMKQLLPDEETGEGYITEEHKEYDTNKDAVNDGGIVGEENNTDIPDYQNDAEDELNSDDTPHYERDTKYDLGYLLTQTERAQGTVKDASISVVVTTENAYMSRDERNAIIQLVKNATNIPEEKISVYSRESDEIPAVVDPNNDNNNILKTETRRLLIILGACGLIFLILAGLIIFLVIRNMKKKMRLQQEESEAKISDLQEVIEENNKKSLEEAAEEHNKAEKATEMEVREFAKNNPEITAALIRSMLKERD